MKRLLPLLAAVLGAAVLASGCSSTTRPVAASVNGTEITRQDLDDDLDALAQNEDFVKYYEDQGVELVPASGGFAAPSSSAWLSSLVSQAVVDDEVDRRGLEVTNADRTEAEQAIAQSETFGGTKIFGKFPKWFREELAQRQARTAALAASLAEETQATETELRSIYEQNREAFCPSGRLVAHILVATPEEATAVETELAAGADFAELARTRSTDTGSGPVGGLLTCIDSQEWAQYDQTFREGAAALEIGEISQPVQTQFGYHVITVKDFTFENARPFLEAAVQQNQNPVSTFVNRKLAKAKLRVDPRYGKVVRDAQGTRIEPPTAPEPRTRPSPETTSSTTPLQGGTGGSTSSP